MSLHPGHKLAHYEILEPIGKGGMGEVFRALDSKLGRDVAIKVLPDDLAQDEERLRRFRREAKVLASLNHPNIASIHGFETSGGTHYLVLELVPGETVAERIARGPIPVEEALRIVTKIAEALEDAHENGIVHRDLKPANIKLTNNDKVKVLDFGLAKALVDEAPDADSSMSPTITRDATRVGVILGTAAYMSPEQAKGKVVDRRSDVFALGAVLYEMLTGKRAFAGEDVSETLAVVITKDVDWSALPSGTPLSIRRLLRRALQKNRRDRLPDAADFRLEIEEAFSTASEEEPSVPSGRPNATGLLAAALLAPVVVGTLVGLFVWNLREPLPPLVARFTIPSSPAEPLELLTQSSDIAIAPDGSRVVYLTRVDEETRLRVRPLDQMTTRVLATTTNRVRGLRGPFVSPDGEWVGFEDGDLLKRVAFEGGAPVTICPVPSAIQGASWGDDDTIVFSTSREGLFRVPASGGEAVLVASVRDNDQGADWPHVLPGSGAALVTEYPDIGDASVVLLDLDTGVRETLVKSGEHARYLRSGHIVFVRGSDLWAIRFHLGRMEVEGEPRPLGIQVLMKRARAADFAISDRGTLAFVPTVADAGTQRLVWVDRRGQATNLGYPDDRYAYVRVSPDGGKLAVDISNTSGQFQKDVWIYEVERGARVRLTAGGGDHPVWTPDGERVVFQVSGLGLYWRPVDASEDAQLLFAAEATTRPGSFSPDGSLFVFATDGGAETKSDIWTSTVDGQSAPLLATSSREEAPVLSPDGQLLAYVSDETGSAEVYVQPFPGTGGRVPVSIGGGRAPIWSPEGSELFYRSSDDRRVLSVSIAREPVLSAGPPEELFEGDYFAVGPGDPHYDVSRDGQRFLMMRQAALDDDATSAPHIVVIVNWSQELERILPTND